MCVAIVVDPGPGREFRAQQRELMLGDNPRRYRRTEIGAGSCADDPAEIL
ncbi:hypothetical protein [Nocardia uniformis]|nr:hypothetical protein [Nocardia uniformis]